MSRVPKLELLESRQLLTISAIDAIPGTPWAANVRLHADSQEQAYFAFPADTDEFGVSLHSTDGESSRAITENSEGHPLAGPRQLVTVRESLFFTATADTGDQETRYRTDLYSYDGNADNHPIALTKDVYPWKLAAFENGVAFIDPETNRLWTSDGTREGTQAVSEPIVDSVDSPSFQLSVLKDQILISAVGKTQLWQWNSNNQSLMLVHDFAQNGKYSSVEVRDFNDQSWLRVVGESGSQLWRYDANTNERVLVYEWSNAFVSWNDVAVFGEDLVFTVAEEQAFDPYRYNTSEFTNRQLWRSDGTADGTTRLNVGVGRMIIDIAVIGDSLFYVQLANDGEYDLWKIESRSSLPEIIHEFERIVPQTEDALLASASTLFFVDGSDVPGESDTVFRYDNGLEAQPALEIETGIDSDLSAFASGFSFTTVNTDRLELWVSDGSPNGTRLLHEVATQRGSQYIADLVPLEDQLLFFARSLLWARDADGRSVALGETEFLPNLVSPDGSVHESSVHQAAWHTDGTREGTFFVSYGLPVEPSIDIFSASQDHQGLVFPVAPLTIGDTTYSAKSTPEHGPELWATREGRTWMVKDIIPGEFGSHPLNLFEHDGILYFGARDRTTIYRFIDVEEEHEENWELWRSDGTSEGTYKFLEINPHPESFPVSTSSSDPDEFLTVERGFLFQATYDGFARFTSPTRGRGWFSSDGTPEGTFRLSVLDGLTKLAVVGDKPFFWGLTGLWTTDGTQEGTVQLQAFSELNGANKAGVLVTPEGTFLTAIQSNTMYVWRLKIDGDIPELVPVATIPNGNSIQILSSRSGFPITIGGFLVENRERPMTPPLIGVVTDSGSEVWTMDDVSRKVWASEPVDADTTVRVSSRLVDSEQIFALAGTNEPFLPQGDESYFVVRFVQNIDGVRSSYSQTWVTDGTDANTFEIIQVGREPRSWHFINDRLYFVVDHPELGYELWSTDGTSEGTFVYDIAPGVNSSSPNSFVVWRSELHFTVDGQIWKVGDTKLEGDINDDKTVDFADFLSVSHNFGKQDATKQEGDVTGDGMIDFADFLAISFNFGLEEQPAIETLEPTKADLEHVEAFYAKLKFENESN